MMRDAIALFAAILFLTLPSNSMARVMRRIAPPSADAQFEALANEYIQQYLAASPEAATQLGDHRYDDKLDDYSLEAVRRERETAQRYLDKLNAIDLRKLSRTNSVDYRILRSRLEYAIFQIDELREYEWNPLHYNLGGAIYALVARDYAPLPQRLRSVKARLEQFPVALAQAKLNLKNPPRVYTETAIAQNKGTISLVRDELQTFIAQAPEMRTELAPAQAKAIAALEDYDAWLQSDLLPRSNGDFRLGDAKFRKKLRFALDSDLSKEEILRRAEQDLKRTQETMYEVALPLFKSYFPNERDAVKLNDRKFVIKSVLDKLAEKRPTNDTIVALANEDLKQATDFVRVNKIVSLPDSPVKVVVMPEFSRGVSVAYCNAAGALGKNGETFFAISPTPKDWSSARVESYFKEYNDYMVQDLTIHEAMPGHYLQLAHSNQFKAPTLVRAVFRSGMFAEGWAVYGESVMAEKGYGGVPVRMEQLKMLLRVIVNAIIDQRIHTAGMTEQDAIAFMMNEGFQEEGEAVGKWRRAQLSSTQLSTYYVGSVEITDIRRAYQKKMGARFRLQQAHDLMLSFGTPPPKYVREMMEL